MSNFTPQQVVDYLLGENGTFSERKSARMAAERIMQQQERIAWLEKENFALVATVEQMREGLEWIVRVNAMDYEYRAVAKEALSKADGDRQ